MTFLKCNKGSVDEPLLGALGKWCSRDSNSPAPCVVPRSSVANVSTACISAIDQNPRQDFITAGRQAAPFNVVKILTEVSSVSRDMRNDGCYPAGNTCLTVHLLKRWPILILSIPAEALSPIEVFSAVGAKRHDLFQQGIFAVMQCEELPSVYR